MGVILQAAYRRAIGVSVPSPADGDPTTPWWWDHVAAQANAWRSSGFSAVLLPPVLKTPAGASPGADGYGVYDDYDLGSKNQFGSVPTRFGSRQLLQRCIAIMRANGLDVYADVVPHQRQGGENYTYNYQGAVSGTPGRFHKFPDCFFPNVPRDPIAGPIADDFQFGDELCPINAKPLGYVMDGLIAAGNWLTQALGVQGYRMDDVKGMAVEFVRTWLESGSMEGQFAVGEYFDGDPQTLNWWCWESGMMGRCNVFDFSLRFSLAAMCNNQSSWDMAQLDHAGLAGISPLSAVTFVENPDTDTSFPVIWNKILGYAYILTSEGYPCVFYKDYSSDPGCYNLGSLIDNLVWIHENLAFGTTVCRWKDFQSIVYERQGYPTLLVGLNNGAGGSRSLTVQTAFGSGVQLHDYTGHGDDVWTGGQGEVTLTLPPNDNGLGYVAYSRTGYGQGFAHVPRVTTQVFEGAADLDIGPLSDQQTVTLGPVWLAAGSPARADITLTEDAWATVSDLQFEVVDPSGTTLGALHWSSGQPPPGPVRFAATRDGWYRVNVTGRTTNRPGTPFSVAVQYHATSTLEET
jgi:alpha-amylase